MARVIATSKGGMHVLWITVVHNDQIPVIFSILSEESYVGTQAMAILQKIGPKE